MKLFLGLICLAALHPAAVRAQSGGGYAIDWSTVDTGGAMVISGGTFTMGVTAGQPEAAPALSAGAIILTGGFWSLFTPDCGGRLTIRVVGNQIQVSWPASETNCVLVGSTTVTGLSTGVPLMDTASGNTYTQPLNSPRRYFQLRQR